LRIAAFTGDKKHTLLKINALKKGIRFIFMVSHLPEYRYKLLPEAELRIGDVRFQVDDMLKALSYQGFHGYITFIDVYAVKNRKGTRFFR
jgi:hypothetical protein